MYYDFLNKIIKCSVSVSVILYKLGVAQHYVCEHKIK